MKKDLSAIIKEAGGAATVASWFGISVISVYEWIKRGTVPAERCPEIERLSLGRVLCEDLNDSVDWSFVRKQKGGRRSARRST